MHYALIKRAVTYFFTYFPHHWPITWEHALRSRIIARKAEQQILQDCLESDQSEFLALFGRLRVGKTYLVKE